MLSFVLYKLYNNENLIYPPPLDVEQDERGETVGAFRLVENKATGASAAAGVSKKAVKRAIAGLATKAATVEDDEDVEMADESEDDDEDFVERPSKNVEVEDVAPGVLPTYTSLLATSNPSSSKSLIFSPYTFYLSRETSSRTWEFVIRALGGKVVTSLSAPSPSDAANANTITHVLVDRPMTDERRREMEAGRKWTWVQPQWVADCVNRSKVLGTDEYGPGKLLPPHTSPWDGEGEPERPWMETEAEAEAADEDEDEAIEQDDEESDEEESDEPEAEAEYPPALLAAAQSPADKTLLHAAELEAEANGTSHAAFKAQLKEATKTHAKAAPAKKAHANGRADEDLRKIMMSNKKAKLYEKMKYSNAEKTAEVSRLQAAGLRRKAPRTARAPAPAAIC
jgi:pescadillo protein